MSSIINESIIFKFNDYIKDHPNVINYNVSSNVIALNAYRMAQKGLFTVGEVDSEQQKNIEARSNSKNRVPKDFGVRFSKKQTIQKNKSIKYWSNPKSSLATALTQAAVFSGLYETNVSSVINKDDNEIIENEL